MGNDSGGEVRELAGRAPLQGDRARRVKAVGGVDDVHARASWGGSLVRAHIRRLRPEIRRRARGLLEQTDEEFWPSLSNPNLAARCDKAYRLRQHLQVVSQAIR